MKLSGAILVGCPLVMLALLAHCQRDSAAEKGTTMTSETSSTAPALIEWLQWSPEAFKRAAVENKLVLLDIGATWCHWCHVMDRVTYEDAEVVRLVNERFVPVRIDRDRMPEVDARMQRGRAIIAPTGAAGGWLTAPAAPPAGAARKKTFFLFSLLILASLSGAGEFVILLRVSR